MNEKSVNRNICAICKCTITTAIFKYTGVCCENHRKQRDGETERTNMASDATLENLNRTLHYMSQLMAEHNKALVTLTETLGAAMTESNELLKAACDRMSASYSNNDE